MNKIPVNEPEITKEDMAKVFQCLSDGWISGISPYIEEFESKFAEWNGTKHAIMTNSGTTALHLALAALGISKDDEVIMPTFTMIACPNAVSYLGAKPIFVDSHPKHWNINENKIEAAITPTTKAIMPVHIYGHPCVMDKILEIADENSLLVVEDCSEAHGAEFRGRKVGTFGDVGTYSMYANKIITTGEGGVIVTDSNNLAEKCKWLRAHAFGRHGKHYWHERIGYGYRPSGLQAALGTSQLARIEAYIKQRIQNAQYYMGLLMPLKMKGQITFPPQYNIVKNVYWMFTILIEEAFGMSRDEVMAALAKEGIETRTTFYPIHVQPPYRTEGSFPVAESLAAKGINLPSGNTLAPQQIYRICNVLRELSGDLEAVRAKEEELKKLEVIEVNGKPVKKEDKDAN